MRNLVVMMIAGGTGIAGVLSGFMAHRAASLQRRGQAVPVIGVR